MKTRQKWFGAAKYDIEAKLVATTKATNEYTESKSKLARAADDLEDLQAQLEQAKLEKEDESGQGSFWHQLRTQRVVRIWVQTTANDRKNCCYRIWM